MCGIVGIVGEQPRREEIAAMAASVRHRGPDAEGVHLAPGIGLGSTRLAIVDLSSAGSQPMSTPDGRYWLVYNGEIYNHLAFRPELEAAGVRFRGRSDTETLLWLLVHRGDSVLRRLNGIFAFLFWDERERRLLAARDHLGVKPLYYVTGRKGRLLFASEIKALFAAGDVTPRVNAEDLLELLAFHFIAGPRTAFDGVVELPPGHCLRAESGRVVTGEYWSPLQSARRGNGSQADPGRLRQLLAAAVERQLMADVPVGIMSSGGLDSGIVSALARNGAGPRTGYCFRDPARQYDEWEPARSLAQEFGVRLEEVRLADDEIPDLLERAAWFYDEPIPRPHHLAAYAVARAARGAGIKVLLAGEGGDEVFGGYRRYAELAAAMDGGSSLSSLVWAHNRVALPRVARFWPHEELSNPFRLRCAQETDGLDAVNRQLLVDQRTFLQHFLQRSDRMGMAEGVEVRVPLLDVPLVEYANSLPGAQKVGPEGGKLCLKLAVHGVLPRAAIERPKQPFEMPIAPLLRDGPVARLLDDLLLASPRCAALFDRRGFDGLIRDFRAGQEDLWKVVWLLLTTELWMRTFRVVV
jgi:asparagine synthase (glutamine-hydrolysing)